MHQDGKSNGANLSPLVPRPLKRKEIARAKMILNPSRYFAGEPTIRDPYRPKKSLRREGVEPQVELETC